jgi:hypothetical protein
MFLTYLARKYGVAKRAKKRAVFYPVTHSNWQLLCGPPELVKAELTVETRTIHLWRSVLIRKMGTSPPPGSYLEALCRAHDLPLKDPIGDEGQSRELPASTAGLYRA